MSYYPPLMGYMLLMLTPLLVGVVVGFLLLDQRDDQTLVALQVTPLTLSGYLVYRLATPMLFSLVITLIALPLSGLAGISLFEVLLCALLAAPLAPLYALWLASFAQNKVQGFALQKASGVIMLPPLLAFFIHSPWTVLLGLFPTYWPARLLWALQYGEPGGWVYLLVGLLYQGLLLALLVRRFNHILHQ
jgi:fluoroquinolone transport system permease protein